MLQPGQRYWSMVEPFWLILNESWNAGPEGFSAAFAKVPSKAGHLYAAHWCQSEVRNGGFHQFFYNTTGLLAPEAANGFRRIGIDPWADLLVKAVEFFGASYPRDRVERCRRLPRSNGRKRVEWDLFYTLDKLFYEWLHAEKDRWRRMADVCATQGPTEIDGLVL